MKTTEGFSFIELIIGLLITSILSLVLYQIFNQTQRSTKKIQSMMDYTILAPTIYNQLEQDIGALFVPDQVFKELEKKEKQAQQKNNKQPEPKKPGIQKADAKKIKPIKDIFYSHNKNKNLETLSFITTHSLSLYNSIIPRNVRIVYKLVPQANSKGLYRLTRQETTDIAVDLKQFKGDKIRAYNLLTHIKDFTVRFLVPEKLPQPKKDQEKKIEKSKPRVYKEFFTWQPEEMKGKSEYAVPAFVFINGTFIDPLTQRERSFEWEFEVAGFDGFEERLKQIKYPEEKPKEPAKKPGNKKPSGTSGLKINGLKKSPFELKGKVAVVPQKPVGVSS